MATYHWEGKDLQLTSKGLDALSKIKEIAEKYGFSDEAYWPMVRGGYIVGFCLKHDACELIGERDGITLISLEEVEINGPDGRIAVKATAQNSTGKVDITYGEASTVNCGPKPYLWCMAEKRAKDRAILKLTGIYAHGIYSEEEAEDFKKEHFLSPSNTTSGIEQKPTTPPPAPKPTPSTSEDPILDEQVKVKGNLIKWRDVDLGYLQWCVSNQKGPWEKAQKVLEWRQGLAQKAAGILNGTALGGEDQW